MDSFEQEIDYSNDTKKSQIQALLKQLFKKQQEGGRIERGGTNFAPPPSEITQSGQVLGPEILLALLRPEFSGALNADSLAATGEDSPGVRAGISQAYELAGREGNIRRRGAELDLAAKRKALGPNSRAGGGGSIGEVQAPKRQSPAEREASMRAKEISRQLLEEQLASLRGQRESFENKSEDQNRTRDSIIPQLLRLLQGARRNFL